MASRKISSGTVHKLPTDIRAALTSDQKVLAAWERITPLARNEWICWIVSAKKLETRKDHIRRMKEELKEGARRPCCWYGCIHRTDKPISQSVKNVVLNKQRRGTHTR